MLPVDVLRSSLPSSSSQPWPWCWKKLLNRLRENNHPVMVLNLRAGDGPYSRALVLMLPASVSRRVWKRCSCQSPVTSRSKQALTSWPSDVAKAVTSTDKLTEAIAVLSLQSVICRWSENFFTFSSKWSQPMNAIQKINFAWLICCFVGIRCVSGSVDRQTEWVLGEKLNAPHPLQRCLCGLNFVFFCKPDLA